MMNRFVDVLQNNSDAILDTNTLPGIVLATQRVLVENQLEDTDAGKQLIKAMLDCKSHTEAAQQLFKFMI